MEKELPQNWISCKLEDIATVQSGGTPSRGNLNYWNGKIPWVKISDIQDFYVTETTEFITEEGLKNSSARIFPIGTILFTIFATIGRVGVLKIEASTNQAIAGITPSLKINSNYLTYSLVQLSNEILGLGKGIAQKNINQTILKNTGIPLPPRPEQDRIVAKLDKLFGQLDTINESLEKIPVLLKNFRQQVLIQAVTGKLTEEWRKGKGYGNWVEVPLEELADVIDPQPSHRTPPVVEDGVPYVSIKDVDSSRKVNIYGARKVSKKVLNDHIKRYDLQEGDFGFGKIGTLGKPFLLPIFQERKYTLSANIILIQPRKKCVPKFVYYYLDSPLIAQKLKEGTSSTSQPAFGIKKARKFPTPLPTIEEQNEIVTRVENLLKKADGIEQNYYDLKEKIDLLPRSILHIAFKGELVPQLESDGDARELLEEIKELKKETNLKQNRN